MLRSHRNDELLSRIDTIEKVVGINLPRIATLENQTADTHRQITSVADVSRYLIDTSEHVSK